MKKKSIITALFLATIWFGQAQQLSQKVGTNPTLIQPSAVLEVESTTKGFLPPRMTEVQMNAIATSTEGLIVYCTDCTPKGLYNFDGTDWSAIGAPSVVSDCDVNGFVGAYVNGIATSGTTFSVTITNNSFSVATLAFQNSDLVLSGVTGLIVGTPTPTSATLNAGQSQLVSYPITGTPAGATGTLTGTWSKLSLNCVKTLNIVTCGAPTSSGEFLVFKCHNLGADESADPFIPSWQLNGAYFQWGKKPVDTNSDGYRTKPNSGTEGFAAAPTGSTAGTANDAALASWSTTAAANGAWNVTEGSPIKTANDPCPSGYRVPTRNEWVSIYGTTPVNTQTNWSNVGPYSNSPTNYSAGKNVNNTLYLPASGYRDSSNSTFYEHGSSGYYWGSTENGTDAYYLGFFSCCVYPASNANRLFGLSVRCVAE